MVIGNLQFFDKDGYNLNFEFNEKYGYWEGSIYLPRVSVGLYANTSIYVLEKIENSDSDSDSILTNEFFFPTTTDSTGKDKIIFTWDKLNKFVDEFFMFNFDENYILTETSALVYTPNDGPDCNTLIINQFDKYEVPLETNLNPKALPIHVAFMAHEKYDASTYNRTLVMSYKKKTIARIKFYAETVEEDERLKIWNSNLGYNITPEDEMIFYKSDIKEFKPDYKLLNEKRKELMMEGSNIYPYIGSYKAIINAIKFFGYDNLNIIEYWRNVNPKDENFGKIYHSSKYSLTKKETLRIGVRNIILPNKDYKKINAIALVYSINQPTGETDMWELPLVKEKFTYTIEEALIKLFALRKKLNKEFMPGTSRIIDIIGEANYFNLHSLKKIHDEFTIKDCKTELHLDFDIYPHHCIHITDNEYFNRYINYYKKYIEKNNNTSDISYDIPLRDQLLSDISGIDIDEISGQNDHSVDSKGSIPETLNNLTNIKKCDYFRKYYQDVFVDYSVYKAIMDNDDYPFHGDTIEYNYTDPDNPYSRFSAKTVIKNTTFENTTFENSELKFGCIFSKYLDSSNGVHNTYEEMNSPGKQKTIIQTEPNRSITFGNVNEMQGRPDRISWKIRMSKNQIDEDLKNIGIIKEYPYHNLEEIETGTSKYTWTNEPLYGENNFNELFVQLPYVGYYDVTMELGYSNKPDMVQKITKTKYIKVEPYNIEIQGFYYDVRELPKDIQYETDKDGEMYRFIQDNIRALTGWAVSERTDQTTPDDYSMPTYTAQGEIINTGPYYNQNIYDEWYLADNLTYEISRLLPLVEYTRYIRSGVDVKPYTWFLLTYDYSKIAGKVNPEWRISFNGNVSEPYKGRYFTLLLKKEGNYTIILTIEDKNGNKYEMTRNIIVVSKTANYKLYQTFKKEYDFMVEQELLKELNEAYYSDKNSIEQ